MPLPFPALPALALGALLAAFAASAADREKPVPVFAIDDPAGDGYGPGTYQPPGDTQFRDGDFDLRRFEVFLDGDDVVLEVTLGAPIRLPDVTQRDNRTALQFLNGVYLQNVDVYVDTDRAPGSGTGACIPGRRVGFAGGRTWESAVVITPQPGPARAAIADGLGPDAARVVVATGVVARGRTLVARVPASALGGKPEPSWGWSVQLSGARWEGTFDAGDRVRGVREVDAFTMPVTTVVEAYAFGGAPANSRAHPRVIDVILPPGMDQRKVLSGYDVATNTYARVPFVYADGSDPLAALGPGASAPATAPVRAPPNGRSVALPDALRPRLSAPTVEGRAADLAGARPAAAPPAGAAWTVADVSGDVVTVSGPTAGLAPLRIGRVLGSDGTPVAKVVITRVLEGGVTASVAEGRDRVVQGARVTFEGAGP